MYSHFAGSVGGICRPVLFGSLCGIVETATSPVVEVEGRHIHWAVVASACARPSELGQERRARVPGGRLGVPPFARCALSPTVLPPSPAQRKGELPGPKRAKASWRGRRELGGASFWPRLLLTGPGASPWRLSRSRGVRRARRSKPWKIGPPSASSWRVWGGRMGGIFGKFLEFPVRSGPLVDLRMTSKNTNTKTSQSKQAPNKTPKTPKHSTQSTKASKHQDTRASTAPKVPKQANTKTPNKHQNVPVSTRAVPCRASVRMGSACGWLAVCCWLFPVSCLLLALARGFACLAAWRDLA